MNTGSTIAPMTAGTAIIAAWEPIDNSSTASWSRQWRRDSASRRFKVGKLGSLRADYSEPKVIV